MSNERRQRLGAGFLAGIDPAREADARPAIDAISGWLDDQVTAAEIAWPGVSLAPERFAGYVAARLPDRAAPLSGLEALQGVDLYLADACVAGDPRAIEHFEARCGPEIVRGLATVDGLGAAEVDELRQVVRVELLTAGADGAPPRLTRYSGNGSIGRWVEVVAMRRALQSLRSRRRGDKRRELSLEQLPSAGQDAELAHLKQTYREAVRVAFASAMDTLEPRSINVLRQRFVDGLTTIELGELYGVNQSTASRWVQAAQRELLEKTREALLAQLDIDHSVCDSVLNLVRSQLDISIFRHLTERA